MDYTVVFPDLASHASRIEELASEARRTVADTDLAGAAVAMPGSLSGNASRRVHHSFGDDAMKTVKAMEVYHQKAIETLTRYRQQEEDATQAINSFFGGLNG